MMIEEQCKGSLRYLELRKRVGEAVKLRGNSIAGGVIDISNEIDQELETEHILRVQTCPHRKISHEYRCGCHWCTHDKEHDLDTENCAACQADKWVFKASSNWSTHYLVEAVVDDVLEAVKIELVGMMEDPDQASEITISTLKMTHKEWWDIILTDAEFVGFE